MIENIDIHVFCGCYQLLKLIIRLFVFSRNFVSEDFSF